MLSDGLLEVGDASPDELFAALRAAPASQAQAAIELVSNGLEQSGTDQAKYPLCLALRRASPEGGTPSPRFDGWLAVLERRPVHPPEAVVQSPAPAQGQAAPATGPSAAPSPTPASAPGNPPVVPAPLPEPAGLHTTPPARANPASTKGTSADAKPAAANCTVPSPSCPNGG